jgi:hypothetical protein
VLKTETDESDVGAIIDESGTQYLIMGLPPPKTSNKISQNRWWCSFSTALGTTMDMMPPPANV